jgi:hypothetical protein
MMTPLHWQILLHHYASSAPYAEENPRHANSQAVTEYKAQLAEWDLIEWRDGVPQATARGIAFVRHIRNLPLPECRWFIPEPPTSTVTSNHNQGEN